MLRKVRIGLALLFFTAITLLFLDFTGVLHLYLGWLAKVQLLPAVLSLNVAVVLVRHLSNFTDFNVLERDPRVHLFYTSNTDDLKHADIIIIPGSKSTVTDLYELRRNGVAQAVVRAYRDGATVLGICGGYQMMGMEVCDPMHLEGDIERIPGLGLLPVSTTIHEGKTTRQTRFHLAGKEDDGWLEGYEIHSGSTVLTDDSAAADATPLTVNEQGETDGCRVSSSCMGTYIHGILDNEAFINSLLAPFAERMKTPGSPFDIHAFKEQQYDRLADHVRAHIDMNKVYQILSEDD